MRITVRQNQLTVHITRCKNQQLASETMIPGRRHHRLDTELSRGAASSLRKLKHAARARCKGTEVSYHQTG